MASNATSGVDHRSQSLVGHSTGEAAAAHGGNGMGVVAHVHAGGRAEEAVDPCEADVTRASVAQKGRFEY